MKNNNYLIISGVLIITAIVIGILYHDCNLTFKGGVSTETIIKSIINFTIIAVLIERFSNMLLIPESYRVFKQALRAKESTFNFFSKHYVVNEEEASFKRKFAWVSFSIGVVVSALGLRYFYEIVESDCIRSSHEVLFATMDIFLSAILMSGGSTLILKIINLIPDNNPQI